MFNSLIEVSLSIITMKINKNMYWISLEILYLALEINMKQCVIIFLLKLHATINICKYCLMLFLINLENISLSVLRYKMKMVFGCFWRMNNVGSMVIKSLDLQLVKKYDANLQIALFLTINLWSWYFILKKLWT